MRVLFTDYNSALISICNYLDEDSYCMPGHGSVILYTRTGAITKRTQQMMVQAENTICLADNELVLIQHQGLYVK